MDTSNDTRQILDELLREKRKDRFWKTLRSLLWLALFAYSLFLFMRQNGDDQISTKMTGKHHVNLIRLEGMIAPGNNFSAEEVVPLLQKAFSDTQADGVILDINSGGGTPVQAAIIHDAIVHYKKKFHKKVVVVGEDLMTSGAYYVAVAADKIYVNPNTLTGSIGVIMRGFGFVDAMKKLGIERRVYAIGNQKDRLDPFLPQSADDTQKISSVMHEVHANFAQAVLEGRKGKIKGDPQALFTGDFWSGQTAMNLGLVDQLGNLFEIPQKEFSDAPIREVSTSAPWLKNLLFGMNSEFDRLLNLN